MRFTPGVSAVMTRNGHGPPGGLAVMPATAPERVGKVVYGDGSWQLTIFVTDLQVTSLVFYKGDIQSLVCRWSEACE